MSALARDMLNPNLEPAPCPACGRVPQLRELAFVYGGFGDISRYELKVECRRWFGLRLCFGPHESNWIDKDWFDLGRRYAIARWNAAAAEARSQ